VGSGERTGRHEDRTRRPEPSGLRGSRGDGVTTDSVRRDDRALDAAGGGVDVFDLAVRSGEVAEDPVLRLLAGWRDDLHGSAHQPVVVGRVAQDRSAEQAAAGAALLPSSRRRHASRLVVGSAAAIMAVLAFGGVAVAAGVAQPGSPLWPITKVIYPGWADSREHELAAARDLAYARRAAQEGRIGDARRYLDDADQHSRHIPSGEADRIRQQADQMRRTLRGESSKAQPHPAPSSSPSPSTKTMPTLSPSGYPSPSSPSPSPQESGSTHGSVSPSAPSMSEEPSAPEPNRSHGKHDKES
jgi:hypothetical protein